MGTKPWIGRALKSTGRNEPGGLLTDAQEAFRMKKSDGAASGANDGLSDSDDLRGDGAAERGRRKGSAGSAK